MNDQIFQAVRAAAEDGLSMRVSLLVNGALVSGWTDPETEWYDDFHKSMSAVDVSEFETSEGEQNPVERAMSTISAIRLGTATAGGDVVMLRDAIIRNSVGRIVAGRLRIDAKSIDAWTLGGEPEEARTMHYRDPAKP